MRVWLGRGFKIFFGAGNHCRMHLAKGRKLSGKEEGDQCSLEDPPFQISGETLSPCFLPALVC